MLRGRFTRSQGRNPNNLHIIPIGSVANHRPVPLPPSIPVQQQVYPSVIPVLIPPPVTTTKFFDNNNSNYQGRYMKGRRKRKRKRDRKNFVNKAVSHNTDCQWSKPAVINPTNDDVVETSEEKTVKEETVKSEVPPTPVEEDFEEVEVASSEGDGKKIPVGFRKTKLHYLSYKKYSFFKPKFYNFSSQRTVVNCLNVEDNGSVDVDVDVVSEAEYDECETDVLDPESIEKFGKIIEIEEESSNEITDEGEEETVQVEVEEESNHIVTDEIEESSNAVVEMNEESSDTVIDEGDKIATLADADKLDEKSVENATNEVYEKSTCDVIGEKEKKILPDSTKAAPSTRIYKTCIEGNDDLSQGKSLIQDKLDAWESHLIGLEYLLEIRDKSRVSVVKYHCVLCDEDLDVQDSPEPYVINHINGSNHVTKYLENHFPTSGYSLSKNSKHDFVSMQKLCEKINENLGYYFMCITNNDYYIENNLKIKEIIQKTLHPSETHLKIDKSTFEKTVNSDLSENVSNIIEDIIKKVIPEKEMKTELEKKADSNNTNSECKSVDPGTKAKPAVTKPRPKYKGNNSISAFLRLSFAEKSKLGTSTKGSTSKSANKKTQDKNSKINEQNVKDIKSHDEKIQGSVKLKEHQQITDNTKLVNKQDAENAKAKSDPVLKSPVPKNIVKNKQAEINAKPKSDAMQKSPVPKNVVKNKQVEVNSKSDSVQKSPMSKNVVKNEQVEENAKLKKDPVQKSPVSKKVMKNVPLKEKAVIKAVESKDVEPEVNIEMKNGHLKEEVKEIKVEALEDNSTVVESHEGISNVVKIVPTKKVFKNKSGHHKYCPKRILDKGITRLRLAAAKATTKGRLVTQVSDKSNVKCKSVTENVDSDAPKKIIAKKIKPDSKESKLAVTSPHKKKPLFKVISVQKPPAVVDSKPSTGHTHLKSAHKKSSETASKEEVKTVTNDSSLWIPMKASSPVLTSDISLFLKKIAVGHSESPAKKRRLSKSPVRRITSPIRVAKNYSRKYSKSPHRKRDSNSPVRRKSRSPYRKLSKSPIRRSRSPLRRRSRSPLRRHSRSPIRRHSRSPRRRSRSPRRRSRSPVRHRSRSPFRRQSRSPFRRHSRSPGRKRSKSPLRKYSRSPLRRYSRSPLRRHSRSPLRRLSRSPLRRHSRSPLRKNSRSPLRRHSRSPVKRRSRSPQRRYSRSPKLRSRSPGPKPSNYSTMNKMRNLRPIEFSNMPRSGGSQEYYNPDERYRRNAFDFPKHLDIRESEMARSRDSSKMMHSSKLNKSDKYKPQPSVSARETIDLDPISDEDESIYFGDKHDTTIAPASKMLTKLIQKLPGTDNTGDLALNNMLQFMETHKAEIEEFIALKSTPKSEKTVKIDSNLQQQTLLLQQYLLSNLAGNLQESVLGRTLASMQFAPTQPPFVPGNISHTFRHPTVSMPPQAAIPPVLPQAAPLQPRFFPPNVNVPPPHLFQPNTQSSPDFSPKPKPPAEVMFKDLKATVNKLFGANEGGMKPSVKPQVPAFVTEPDPEKWDLNHPNAPKFNVAHGPKNVFPSSGKNINFSNVHENPVMREQLPSRNNNAPGQFFRDSNNDRPQVPEAPPPNAKVTFCDSPRSSSKGNLFPVVNPNFSPSSSRGGVNDVKVSLAQRLASVLVKIGMVDVPAPLLQEMLMKIGAFSSSPRQDISENEILSILKRLGYLS